MSKTHFSCGLTLAFGVGGAAACGAMDTKSPEIESASFVEADPVIAVRLQFTEPIADPEGVDPALFRLGAVFVVDDNSIYYDVAHHFDLGVPGVEGENDRHGSTFVTDLVPDPDDPSALVLELSFPIEGYVCDAIDTAVEAGIVAAIHVHYRGGESPGIEDEAGNSLADIAGWWASTTIFRAEYAGELPELDVRIEIPCP